MCKHLQTKSVSKPILVACSIPLKHTKVSACCTFIKHLVAYELTINFEHKPNSRKLLSSI
jgi:hypothetical protein